MNIQHLSPASLKRIENIFMGELQQVEDEIAETTQKIKALYERRNELLKDLGIPALPRAFRSEPPPQEQRGRKRKEYKHAPMKGRFSYVEKVLKGAEKPLTVKEVAERIFEMEGITSRIERERWTECLYATMNLHSRENYHNQRLERVRYKNQYVYMLKTPTEQSVAV